MQSQAKPIIGVLALQGAVEAHKLHIEACGAEFKPVKTAKDFEYIDAFIIPGGESTTMLKLIERFNLWDILKDQFSKKPVWGICAGSILLAKTVLNPEQESFNILPITIKRNGYGRQLDSHYAKIDGYEVSFIRAPIISEIDESVKILASHKSTPVWVKYSDIMATTFHPELTMKYPSPMHRAFIDLI